MILAKGSICCPSHFWIKEGEHVVVPNRYTLLGDIKLEPEPWPEAGR